MHFMEWVRTAVEGIKASNYCSLKLAIQKPHELHNYLSFCLRRYDDIACKGLPQKSVIRELGPSDLDTLVIPARFQTGGGTDPREILTLATVTRLLQPKRIFEIGTYHGGTTGVFILNSPPGCEVFTLDLPPAAGNLHGYISSDIELVRERKAENYLMRSGLAQRCRQISCDSMQFDPEPFRDSVELAFIDGAHAEEFVRNDTMKMAIMMTSRGYVFWHDYGGCGAFRPLARYLESLPIELYRMPSTTLAWTTAAELKKLAAPRRSITADRQGSSALHAQAG